MGIVQNTVARGCMDRWVGVVAWVEYEADPFLDIRTTTVPFNDDQSILTWRRMTSRLVSADAWVSGFSNRPSLQNASSQGWSPAVQHLGARLRKISVGCGSFGCEKSSMELTMSSAEIIGRQCGRVGLSAPRSCHGFQPSPFMVSM